MPLFFLVVGAAFIAAALRGKQADLFALLKADFTGSSNFGIWVLAIGLVGALGYIPGFKTLSNGLLVLVILVILLGNKGFFSTFQQQVSS